MADSPTARTIFVVDDDLGLVRLIEKTLHRDGFQTASASSGRDAMIWLNTHQADLMLLDLKLQDIEALDLLRHFGESRCPPPFVVITGQGDERVAVEMMKQGALDYVVKDAQFLEFLPPVVHGALAQIDQRNRLTIAEAALRRSEANLAKAQEIAQIGSYEINVADSARERWSAEIYRLLGIDPAEHPLAAEAFINEIVHPEDRSVVRGQFENAIALRAPYNLEYRIVRPDGVVRHAHAIGEPVLDDAGRVTHVVGILQDITDRKRLEREILEISEREQRRIGQDLHDGLGQHLAGIELMSQVLEQRLATGKSKESAALAVEAGKISRHVRDAIGQTRLLARGLSPVVLESEGLMAALRQLAEDGTQMFRVQCEFDCPAPVLVPDNAVATHLYRIAQEALSNAVKHGKSPRTVIRLGAAGERILLAIADQGIGIPEHLPAHRGMGLRIMQYRAGVIGGSLVVQRNPEGGTTIICSVQNHSSQNPDPS
jgi:PAS domain S-box-containing protein